MIFSPSVSGGIAEHTAYQGGALAKLGADVVCLVPPSFLGGRWTGLQQIVCLGDPPLNVGSRFMKHLRMAWHIVVNQSVLAWQIVKRRPDLVLLDSYVEYLAPLWVWPHWILARVCHIRYAANLHDPVRDYRVGPAWWHHLSVRLAYLPLDFVLVHDQLPTPSPVPARVKVAQVPVGIYEIGSPVPDTAAIRRDWGVQDGQKVFLAFGFVRDGKNLDLAIRSLTKVPDAFLIMAGSVAATQDRPYAFYRDLAIKLGVAGRCRFFEGFVADADLGRYFAGTDFVLLTYAGSFHSQSGVLNIAARARKPVLASASPSPLLRAVENYELGVVVAPDSADAVVEGMRQLLLSPPQPRWNEYEARAAWEVNARGVLETAGLPVRAVAPVQPVAAAIP